MQEKARATDCEGLSLKRRPVWLTASPTGPPHKCLVASSGLAHGGSITETHSTESEHSSNVGTLACGGLCADVICFGELSTDSEVFLYCLENESVHCAFLSLRQRGDRCPLDGTHREARGSERAKLPSVRKHRSPARNGVTLSRVWCNVRHP